MPISRRNVLTVFSKELRDTLRDRRTLFAALILPVLINPLLIIFVTSFTMSTAQDVNSKFITVGIVGSEDAPRLTKIVEAYYYSRAEPFVVPGPDDPAPQAAPPPADTLVANDVDTEGDISAVRFVTIIPIEGNTREEQVAAAEAILADKTSGVQAVLVIPENFEADVQARLDGKLRDEHGNLRDPLAPEVISSGSSERSQAAAEHLSRIVYRYLEPLEPLDMQRREVGGSSATLAIASFLPYIVILMVLTAAFTPALDLMAGEKERGTIETLLISPADRRELILGKFLTVVTIAVAATVLNLASLGITVGIVGDMIGRQVAASAAAQEAAEEARQNAVTADGDGAQTQPGSLSQTQSGDNTATANAAAAASAADNAGDETADAADAAPKPATGRTSLLPAIPPIIYLQLLLIMIPAACLFGAVALAISAFAKSYKEGQSYIGPVMMVALPLAMVSLFPGVDFNSKPWLLAVPVTNIVVMFKDLIVQKAEVWHVLVVIGATSAYAALALRWATSVFYREDILFREASEFRWNFWIKPGPPALRPSATAAVFAFVIVLIAFFFVGGGWQTDAAMSGSAQELGKALIKSQVLLLVVPVLLLNRLRLGGARGDVVVRSFRATFPIVGSRLSTTRVLATVPLALLAAPAMAILVMQTMIWLEQAMPSGPGSSMDAVGAAARVDPWFIVGVIAIAPAICEELVFRGYIFSGLSRDARNMVGPIVLTALLFGLMHFSPANRIIVTGIAGLALTWVRWRTGSLLIPMLLHATYNGLIVSMAAFPDVNARVSELLFSESPRQTLINPAFLALAVVALGGLGIFMHRLTTATAARASHT